MPKSFANIIWIEDGIPNQQAMQMLDSHSSISIHGFLDTFQYLGKPDEGKGEGVGAIYSLRHEYQ